VVVTSSRFRVLEVVDLRNVDMPFIILLLVEPEFSFLFGVIASFDGCMFYVVGLLKIWQIFLLQFWKLVWQICQYIG